MNAQPFVRHAAREGVSEVSAAEFRHAMGQFATGITVVTTVDGNGEPYGVTATSFASLSLDPPLVQWSLRNAAWSFPIFRENAHFAVNILASDQETVSRRFASPGVDRFKDLDVRPGTGGLPLIGGAMAWIECALEDTLPGGDHTILIGRVLRTRCFVKTPLLHWRGDYLPIGDDYLARRSETSRQAK